MTDSIDDIEFSKTPNFAKILKSSEHIVVVGAGIIGVCTAYYLTRHPLFDRERHHITILESKRVAGGASGKAGGLLATWAFPQQIVPLSFQLHQDLSDEYDGDKHWDYRRLTTVSLEADVREKEQVGEGEGEEEEEEEENTNSDDGSNSSTKSKSKKLEGLNGLKENEIGCCLMKNSAEQSVMDFESVEDVDDDRGDSRYNDSSDDEDDDDDSLADFDNHDFVPGAVSMTSGQQASNTNSASGNESKNNNSDNCSDNKESANSKKKLPSDLYWINHSLVKGWSSLGGKDSTAQVHPYKFTYFLLKKAMETGAVDIILGKISKIHYSDVADASTNKQSQKKKSNEPTTDTTPSLATGVSYIPTDDSVLEELNGAAPQEVAMDATQVVLCMGPWTSKILPDCPISGLRAHSITIKPEQGTVSPYAIFTELQTSENEFFSPEMYARKDEVYVCGEGDTMVSLPETTADVQVVREKCDELFNYVSKLSTHLSRGHVLKRQACYLPVLNVPTSSGPLIGETNVENLFVASGHSCWGINNAPVTGKVLSELIYEGESKCCDISALDPGLYFDAQEQHS